MTAYYVDASMADDSGNGLSWATATKTIGAAVTLAGSDASTPHTINIANGAYSEGISFTSGYHSNLVLQGASRGGTVISSTSAKALYGASGITGIDIKDLTVKVGGAYIGVHVVTGTDWSFDGCAIESLSNHSDHLFYSQNGTGLSVNACQFRFKHSGSAYPVLLAGTTAGTFSYCEFTAAGHANFSNEITATSSGTINFHHNVILDSYRHGVSVVNSTVNAVNNVIQGGSIGTNASCLARFSGTVNADRNYLICGTQTGEARWILGTVTEGAGEDANIKTNSNPMLKAPSRNGYIIPRFDDTGAFEYAQDVADVLSPYGFKGTFATNWQNWNSADTPALRTMIENGVLEVCAHGYTHSKMTITGDIYSVTKAAETITVSRSADTITLSGGGTVSGFRAKTLAAIKLELEGFGATVTELQIGSSFIREETLGECLDDGVATNALTLLHDATGATGLQKVEMNDVRGLMAAEVNALGNVTDGQTGETYVCNTHAATYNTSDATGRAAARAIGYTSASSANAATDTTNLADFDLYFVGGFGDPFVGANEAETRQRARAIAFVASLTGAAAFVLAHNTGEVTVEQWGWACEEWIKFSGVNVTSYQLMAAEIRDSGNWTDQGDGTYTRTFDYPDLSVVNPSSPLIDGGSDQGYTTDAAGASVPFGDAPDIGAYEYRSVKGLPFFIF